MDIFDKYASIAGRRQVLLDNGADPFNLRMEEMHGPTEALIDGRRTVLAGTNNYLGLTFDPACIEAGVQALRTHGTGTTGSRIANGTYDEHRELEAEMAAFMHRRHAIVVELREDALVVEARSFETSGVGGLAAGLGRLAIRGRHLGDRLVSRGRLLPEWTVDVRVAE